MIPVLSEEEAKLESDGDNNYTHESSTHENHEMEKGLSFGDEVKLENREGESEGSDEAQKQVNHFNSLPLPPIRSIVEFFPGKMGAKKNCVPFRKFCLMKENLN